MMSRLTEVVKHLLIINVIIYFAATMLLPQLGYAPSVLYLAFPGLNPNFQPFQLVTHMFMHGSFTHLLFNMMSLFFLGPMVESVIGSKRFLVFYLICGAGALILHLLLGYLGLTYPANIVGASGAVMGVFVAFASLFPDTKLMLLFPPIPIKAKFLMMALIAFDLFSGVAGAGTGIAHWAHLGGVITGATIMLYWGYLKLKR